MHLALEEGDIKGAMEELERLATEAVPPLDVEARFPGAVVVAGW